MLVLTALGWACGPRFTPVAPAPVTAPVEGLMPVYARAQYALRMGYPEQARAELVRMEQLDPGDPWAAAARARLWAVMGDLERAGESWCEARRRGLPDGLAGLVRRALLDAGVSEAPCAAWSVEPHDVSSPGVLGSWIGGEEIPASREQP